MCKIKLVDVVYDAIDLEFNGDKQTLTATEIAADCTVLYKELGIRRSVQRQSVINCMPEVRKMAIAKGQVVISIRYKHVVFKGNSRKISTSKSLKVYGYRIAGEDDKELIMEDMDIRRILCNGNNKSLHTLAQAAKLKGLFSPEEAIALIELEKRDELQGSLELSE